MYKCYHNYIYFEIMNLQLHLPLGAVKTIRAAVCFPLQIPL